MSVDGETFRQFVKSQALAWSAAEQQHLLAVLSDIRPKLEPAKDLWPDPIVLVKTTGEEEAGAPHCRGNAIVLPAPFVMQDARRLEPILLHELFHILSRQSPSRQRDLYQIVGFQRCSPLELPPELAQRKITNPDAPHVNCVIAIAQPDGSVLHAAPILQTKQKDYESVQGRTLFGELMFRLVVVVPQGENWQVEPAAVSALLDPAQQPDFQRKIGRNTGYIIHPEEILADNFVHLILRTPALPDPWIVDQLRALLMTSP
jgi:hypothetical protein